ncbi:MAG: DinB family protein [Nocardioidaceae bacterium]
MSTWPSVERIDPFSGSTLATDERHSLEAWLEFHRATLLMKCAGLPPAQLVLRSCPPSRLSLLGLVRHMTEVEPWFHAFDGEPEIDGYGTEKTPDAAWESLDPAVADVDLAAYQASVDRSRAAVASRNLDELCPCSHCDEPRSLRWVFEHMVEEYARHNGHADLIREAIDGATGD